jgi:hypothetical protein
MWVHKVLKVRLVPKVMPVQLEQQVHKAYQDLKVLLAPPAPQVQTLRSQQATE